MAVVLFSPSPARPPVIPYADKLVHAFLFGVLAYILFSAFKASGMALPYLGIFLASSVAYGALSEIIQGFIPGRRADVWDFVADVLGVVSGTVAAWLRKGAR